MSSDIRALEPEEFPSLLKEMTDPPKQLYLRGTLPPPDYKLLTVVGSRRMSRYGKDATDFLIRGLAGYPVAIVSGLALGVDAAAHRAAMAHGLPTIALPGSGLNDDVIYPPSHRGLAKEILESGGALLSEFEPSDMTMLHFFPQRNRIMAGMSHATLIIEAGMKSGTLITAKLTVEYNRDLLIVPHPIFDEGGAGGHLFMKLGAAPVRSSEDILEALGLEAGAKQQADLEPDERKVVNLLGSPIERDELIRELGLPVPEANALLLGMELKGLIKESGGEIRKNI